MQVLLEQYPGIRETISNKGKSYKTPLLPFSVTMAFRYLTTSINPTQSDLFLDGLLHGIGLEAGSPVLILRQRLITDLTSVKKFDVLTKFGMLVKAWNAFRSGKTIKTIRYSANEEFAALR